MNISITTSVNKLLQANLKKEEIKREAKMIKKNKQTKQKTNKTKKLTKNKKNNNTIDYCRKNKHTHVYVYVSKHMVIAI